MFGYTYAVYTERFIMCSGITNVYYRKPVGHAFTKPVQIEKATPKKKFPISFSSQFTFLPLGTFM
jgi:hypothetical protein